MNSVDHIRFYMASDVSITDIDEFYDKMHKDFGYLIRDVKFAVKGNNVRGDKNV